MKISVFGLGYVGCVSMACLAGDGNHVVGVDVSPAKVALINSGSPSIVEKDIDALIKKGWESGNIEATDDCTLAVKDCDVSIICVGTPNDKEGHLNLSSIYAVAENIGEALADSDKFHVVTIRSTVLPGTNRKVGAILEERSRRG